jgi:hypothetical protein
VHLRDVGVEAGRSDDPRRPGADPSELRRRLLERDLAGAFPGTLQTLVNPDLVALLATLDPTPDTPVGSGAMDWANLPQRMHFIADLFRTRHEVASLLGPPFSPEQTRVIKAGHRPDGGSDRPIH